MARPVLTLLAALCALLFLPTLAAAQTADPAPESIAVTSPVAVSPARPPKIGLVLSGGGALGLAHIGVLKELERLGIRPDVIVGTSMGALVGGLYASGASAGELESEVVTINWDRVFNAEPDRDGLTYRQKRNQADFPVRASVGLRDWAIKLPEGAVSDQNLTITLRGLVRTKAAVPTFDQLPIPFRAVATDIETGQAVVLDRGNLATAMRASMSVPGVFPPALVNNRLLVDGGMANNIPVNVARAMGAEVVIVVALQAPLLKKDDLNSAVAILGQTVSLLVLANEREQLATLTPGDVLIRVDITDFSAVDFKKAPALIEAGVAAARGQEGRLAALANGGGLPRPVPPPRIDYVRLANDSRLADGLVLDRLNYPVGKELDNAALSKGLEAVYALGAFERVDYDIETVGGRTGLVVRAQEKKAGPQVVRVGMTLANDFRGSNDFAVSFDYRISPLDRFGSEGRIEGVLGSDFRLSGSYFKLLDIDQGWFVEPRLVVESRNVPLFSARGFKSGEYRVTSGIAQLMGGYQFGGVGEIRAGIERGIGRATVAEGTSPFPTLNLSVGQIFLQGGIDTFDNPYFPKKGVLAQLRLTTGQEWLAAREDFTSLEGSAAYAIRLGDGVVTLQAAGGRTLDGVLPPENLFRLGGLTTLSGYQRDELIGEAYAAFRAQYRYRLNSNPLGLVAVPLYVGGSLEAGNMWALDEDFDIANLRAGGSVFVAADTVFGPTFLAYGRSEGNRQAVYLFIGRPF